MLPCRPVLEVRVVVDQIVARYPQYTEGAVRAEIERVMNPPDTAEGYLRHAEELERYFRERDTATR